MKKILFLGTLFFFSTSVFGQDAKLKKFFDELPEFCCYGQVIYANQELTAPKIDAYVKEHVFQDKSDDNYHVFGKLQFKEYVGVVIAYTFEAQIVYEINLIDEDYDYIEGIGLAKYEYDEDLLEELGDKIEYERFVIDKSGNSYTLTITEVSFGEDPRESRYIIDEEGKMDDL